MKGGYVDPNNIQKIIELKSLLRSERKLSDMLAKAARAFKVDDLVPDWSVYTDRDKAIVAYNRSRGKRV